MSRTTGEILAGKMSRPLGFLGFIKVLWKQSRCKHTHCATFGLDGATRLYGRSFGDLYCKAPGLVLCCCYICGHTWVQDYHA